MVLIRAQGVTDRQTDA